MFDCNPTVHELLSAIPDVTITQGWPEKNPGSPPFITFFLLENSPSTNTIEGERISRISYQIDVWAETARERDALAAAVDAAMKTMNFSRGLAHDLVDMVGAQSVKRKMMPYVVYVDLVSEKFYRNPMK